MVQQDFCKLMILNILIIKKEKKMKKIFFGELNFFCIPETGQRLRGICSSQPAGPHGLPSSSSGWLKKGAKCQIVFIYQTKL